MASKLLLAQARRQLVHRPPHISPKPRLAQFSRNLTTRPLLSAYARPRIIAPRQPMLALQTRPFSIGRLFVTATRVPVVLVGAAAGGVAYVNHKIEEYKEKGSDLMSKVEEELEKLYSGVQSITGNIHMPSFLKDLLESSGKESAKLSEDVREAITSEERAAKKIVLRMHQDELAEFAQKLSEAESLLSKLDGFDSQKAQKTLALPPIAVIGPHAHRVLSYLVGLELPEASDDTEGGDVASKAPGLVHVTIEYDPEIKDNMIVLDQSTRVPVAEAGKHPELFHSSSEKSPPHITVSNAKYPSMHLVVLANDSTVATLIDPDALIIATDYASQQTIDPLGRRSVVIDVNDAYTPRRQIAHQLEQYITPILFDIARDASKTLEEAQYSFKVDYDGRSASAESYLAGRMEELKLGIAKLEKEYNRQRVRDIVREVMDREMLTVCERTCWTSQDTDPDVAGSLITRSGVGRTTTQLMVYNIMQAVQDLATDVFGTQQHEQAKQGVIDFAQQILRAHEPVACDQVENTIKPFKYEVEVSEREWQTAVQQAVQVVEQERQRCDLEYKSLWKNADRSELNAAMKQLTQANKNSGGGGDLPFDDHTIAVAARAIALRDKLALLKIRLAVLKSRRCRSLENKSQCQEAFLSAVTEKVTYTASMFLQVELLNEFFFEFSREVDDRLVYGMDQQQIAKFARENPHIMAQLDAQDKRRQLEEVVAGLNELARHRVAETTSFS
ncbi:hypothetical protein K450DRAFT_241995 [Umbelopsis ramanniana AG]|uniref:Dynamin-like GTPase MGM1-like lipid interacting stalk domain-containing protein n=1 Tax=Umbelopsis ramanniana AG TaxID=1314678 RepID=A0AAD5HCS9_UMBRA|nr:uncharacterized protein K450DRAFT_241995 [Umbelopsis ramanniana AG]KAI8579407.1 hypothetical protein K450DRAFT_241995 [Umbelopsis ramanniana AG]